MTRNTNYKFTTSDLYNLSLQDKFDHIGQIQTDEINELEKLNYYYPNKIHLLPKSKDKSFWKYLLKNLKKKYITKIETKTIEVIADKAANKLNCLQKIILFILGGTLVASVIKSSPYLLSFMFSNRKSKDNQRT